MIASDIKSKFSEFSSVDDEAINLQIEESKTLLSVDKCGSKYNLLLSLLVAHELKLSTLGDSASQVLTARSIEGGSMSFKNVATNEYQLYYSKSIYGQKFLAIKKTIRFVGSVCV